MDDQQKSPEELEAEMERRMTSPQYQTMQRRAHGDTPPGFPTRALIDDPSTTHMMEVADPDPGEDQS